MNRPPSPSPSSQSFSSENRIMNLCGDTETLFLFGPARTRLVRELDRLERDPPPGVACYAARLRGERCREWRRGANGVELRARITGPPSTPYAGGLFLIALRITKRYPFEPPTVRFVTPVHHPNVDSRGRICLDTLKSPPAGTWSPAVSLPSLLTTLRALLADPNPDDALAEEVAAEYKLRPAEFRRRAAELTAAEATEATAAALELELDGPPPVPGGERKENADPTEAGGASGKREAEAPPLMEPEAKGGRGRAGDSS